MFADSEDLLIAISSSGNSPNIVKAIERANDMGMTTIAFVGFDGGEVAKSGITQEILFASEPKLYGLIENMHLIACHHIIDELVATDWTQRKQL